MNQRARSNSSYEPSGNGNILFTFGLISVVALLIVGYVMTQGGVGSLMEKGKSLSNLTLVPTEKPSGESIKPTPAPAGPTVAEVRASYEKKITELQKNHDEEIQKLRRMYENQIVDLQTRLQFMEDENTRLQKGNR